MDQSRVSGKELRQSLNLVILAITFGMAFFTVINGPALSGFSRKIGSGDLVYSVIMSMPIIGGILQVFGSFFLERTGRRKLLFLICGFIHRLCWIPIALIPLFIPESSAAFRVCIIIALAAVSSAGNALASVAFNSWIGVLVPAEIKGRFFSKRTMISTITSVITALVIGWLIDVIPGFGGYAVVLVLAAILGAMDILCFVWIKDPPMELPQERISFVGLLKEPLANKNYMRFILFETIWCFGFNFSGPFFNVYMFENLGMSFLIISLFTQFASGLATVFTIRCWGRLADIYGNKSVMCMCGLFLVLVPLIWLFATPNSILIVLFANILAGIAQPGFDMTTFNLTIWLAPEKNRSMYAAGYTLVTALLGVAVAYISGGAFMQFTGPIFSELRLPFLLGQNFNNYHALFIVSSMIRITALVFFLKGFHEEGSLGAKALLGSLKPFTIRLKV